MVRHSPSDRSVAVTVVNSRKCVGAVVLAVWSAGRNKFVFQNVDKHFGAGVGFGVGSLPIEGLTANSRAVIAHAPAARIAAELKVNLFGSVSKKSDR